MWQIVVGATVVALVALWIFVTMAEKVGSSDTKRKVAEAKTKATLKGSRAFKRARGHWTRIARRVQDDTRRK